MRQLTANDPPQYLGHLFRILQLAPVLFQDAQLRRFHLLVSVAYVLTLGRTDRGKELVLTGR